MKFALATLFFFSCIFAAELPHVWQSSGPNDKIQDGYLILTRKTAEERRPEIFQMVEGLRKGRRYEILFQYRTQNPGSTLQLHLNFRDGQQDVFRPDAVSTAWRSFRYPFTAGEGALRVTFLLPSNTLANAEIRKIILREEGELLDTTPNGNLTEGMTFVSYDLDPDCDYRFSYVCSLSLAWNLNLFNYDGQTLGTIAADAPRMDKAFRFPEEAAFLKLTLKAPQNALLNKISLKKQPR